MLDHFIDQAVLFRLLWGKDAVAFDVFFDLIERLAAVVRDNA